MSDSQYNGQTRVQVLLEYLQEREMDLEDLGSVRRIKLEQCIQLCQFETDANQVKKFISLFHWFFTTVDASLGQRESEITSHKTLKTILLCC